jgi:phosphoglycerate dehydrogenase-like enzyme
VATHEHVVLAQAGAEEQVPLLRSLHPDATWSTLPPAMPGWSLDPTLAARTTVLFADFPPTEVAGMGALRWIQLGSHGYAQFNGVELQAQREHRWDRSEAFQAEVTGRPVGILGYGSIGREVTRQMRSLALEVWVMSRSGVGGRVPRYHPSVPPARAWSAADRSFTLDRAEEFYRGLDVLVIAVPISSATAGMVDARALALLRPGALLLNPAHAGVVDEAALLDAPRSGRLGGAALDDHHRQPVPTDDPFFDLPRTLMTSHISGSTGSAFYEQRIWQLFRENLGRYAGGGDMLNVVARDDLELAGEAT